jgi:hypothetical protein
VTNVPHWNKRTEVVKQMLQLGVPLEATEADVMNLRGGNKIRLDVLGGTPETSAFDLHPGATGYTAWVSLTVLQEPFAVTGFVLSVPWPTGWLVWLSDPAEGNGPRNTYRFWGRDGHEFQRDIVINHYANAQRSLPRGKVIEGYLLAYGSEPIPTEFKHGACVAGHVGIIDQFDEMHSTETSFWIDRIAKISSAKPAGPIRKPRFAKAR